MRVVRGVIYTWYIGDENEESEQRVVLADIRDEADQFMKGEMEWLDTMPVERWFDEVEEKGLEKGILL